MTVVPALKPFVGGDCWIRDELSRDYSAESGNFGNATSAPITVQAGTPLQNAAGTLTITTAAQVTAGNPTGGWAIETTVVAPGETKKIGYYARGTSIVCDANMLPLKDGAGASYVLADMKTRLAAFGIIVRDEPTRQNEQVN